MKNSVKVSKHMAYLLRHNPSGLKISEEGFVGLNDLLEKLRSHWPELDEKDIEKLVAEDPKGRYEIRGRKVRARYGHSINVNPTLDVVNVKKLFHGTTPEASQKILQGGLKSKGRKKVHLSKKVEDAISIAERRTKNPVVLELDIASAKNKEGIKVERASETVYVSDDIPSEFISIKITK